MHSARRWGLSKGKYVPGLAGSGAAHRSHLPHLLKVVLQLKSSMAGMKAKESTIPVQGVFEKLSRRSIKRAWNACIHRTLWTHLDLGENLFTDAKHTQYADGRLRRADRGWSGRRESLWKGNGSNPPPSSIERAGPSSTGRMARTADEGSSRNCRHVQRTLSRQRRVPASARCVVQQRLEPRVL